MTATLYYTSGDTDYLKTVVLGYHLPLNEDALVLVQGASPIACCPGSNSHKVVLSLPNGSCLFSSNEVCRFLCREAGRKELCGEDPFHQALIDHWLGWEAGELKHSVKTTLTSGSPSDSLLICLSRLEGHLSTCGGRSLVRDQLSVADIVVWSTLYVLLAPDASATEAYHKDFPRVCRWFISLAQQDTFTSAVWKASNDAGYDSYKENLLGRVKPSAQDSPSKAPPSSKKTKDARGKVEKVQTRQAKKKEDPINPQILPESIDHETVSPEERDEARRVWSVGVAGAPRPVKREHPILPISGERNILITSALPYVNNVPHLGNIIGCVLSADVFARYCRLRNYNVLYICGTDEYGTATETKALEEGVTPQEICEKYHTIHLGIYEWFNIHFDHFGRTSTTEQTQISQDIFWRLHERGFISEDTVEQLQCQKCNMFLADRFVEGICPFCSYEDARGDQCDKCGKLINAIELKSPRCKVCSTSPRVKTSDHLFLDLSKLEPSVCDWFKTSSKQGLWSNNAEHITHSWLRDGLNPRCISRDLKWGTPVPLQGYTNKVFYVWFDAPIGYLSITANYTDKWEAWWKNPDQVQLYQFMAKDNVPFHTVVFPCSLIGADDNYTLLNHISSTEYLNYEEGKFSKSRGVGVFGNNAKDTGIPADIYRFYLLFVRPETQDSSFSWADFVMKNNSELLNNLGNFINRVLMFTKNNFGSTIPDTTLTDDDLDFVAKVTRELKSYIKCLENMKIRDGLRHILSVSRLGNGHMQANKPWNLVKGGQVDKARAGSVIGMCANVVCLLSVMVQPYMPQVSKQIQDQLQAPESVNVLTDCVIPHLKPGHKIGVPVPLFSKIEESTAQSLKEQFAGKQNPLSSKPSQATPTVLPTSVSADRDKEVLQKQLDEQAAVVRQLKSEGGVSKDKIDIEVKKLLELKSKLGIAPPSQGKKGKKSKK